LDRNLLEKNYKKANNQLFNIDCRKSKIKKEIYSLYDIYLTIIRSKLKNYVVEAIKALLDISNDGISIKDQKTILFIKNDLQKLVNKILPFLTIEQLSIKREYKIYSQIKNNREFSSNYNLKEEICNTNNFETFHDNNSINYYDIYYKDLINEDIFKNININNFLLENNSFDNYKKVERMGFINPINVLNNCDEDKLSINIHKTKDSEYFIPIEFKDILLWIDTLENSLNLYLKDLSIQINNELLKKNLLKRFINNELILNIFENHLLFNNPSPLILSFDPSLNQHFNFDEICCENNFSKINLIYINSAELEFLNINLNMLKNKLLEIKSKIYLLIKKENYWCNKLKLNTYIKSTINKL
tara:strand:- start:59 stop:1135 length:1077 start_codon:yes stop_codon:yes gene_type:complete